VLSARLRATRLPMDKITCHVVRKWPDSNLSEESPVLGNGR